MTDAEAARALEIYFNSNWSTTDIFFNQVPANPPEDTEFVSFWVLPSGTMQVGLGSSPEFRTACVIQIDVNVPVGTGTRRAIELGDQVSTLFLGQQISGITVRNKSVGELVVEEFYRRVVRFEGYYDHTLT